MVSAACVGEHCWCGLPAAKKVGEVILFDDPTPARHNLTTYICAEHYAQLMGPLGAKQVGLSTVPEPMEGWRPIETAPKDTPVRVRLGEGMSIIARLVPDASMTNDEMPCDQWQAEHEGEHPECWTDCCCWESNADDLMSMQPRGWMPLPAPPNTED